MSKHPHYELLNLIGYGLAKFDKLFIKEFQCSSKFEFYRYIVSLGFAETTGVVKNRMDLFDPYFENNRKGWWQKAEVYCFRKDLIDMMFGNEDVHNFAEIVKILLASEGKKTGIAVIEKPIVRTKFKRLQETGMKAENYFILHFDKEEKFQGGQLTDARLYGDGYDFQVDVQEHYYLAKVKGIRKSKGRIRLTAREFEKAKEFQSDFILSLVTNLDDITKLVLIDNLLNHFEFKKSIIKNEVIEYRSLEDLY